MQHSIRDPQRDTSHGRIWRVTYKDRPLLKPATIAGAPIGDLLNLLKEYEDRTRYRARRELRDRPTADVVAATEFVAAAIEVIDSRVAGWRIKLPDTIADMASCARIVVSDRRVPIGDVDPVNIRVRISKNGEQVSDGIGSAVLGDPAAAVAWVANTLAPLGVTLRAGDIVMPGAMHASVPVAAGDEIAADFDDLGPVTVRFA
jgi:2-keto-4-pentenoate hydratase